MPPRPDSHFALPKKNVEKATKPKKSSIPAVPVVETKEKRGLGRQTKTPVQASIEETVEAQEASPAKRGHGKKAEERVVYKVDSEEEAVEEVKKTKGKGKKPNAVSKKQVEEEEEKSAVPQEASAPAEEVMETIESPKTVPARKGRGMKAASSLPAVPVVETKEKRGLGRQTKTPVQASIEETVEAQEAAPAKRGHGKKAEVRVVSKVDSEEEAVEKLKETKAKGKKANAVSKKLVEEEEKKSAVLEEAAPAEVMETIESSETVPAKKSRGKKAGKKDAVEEAVFDAEPEVAEKKGRGKEAHPSAESASQVASEVDTDEMDGPSSSGVDVASFIDDRVRQRQQTICSEKTISKAFEEISTMAGSLVLPKAVIDRANSLFKDVHSGKYLKGFSTHVIASACLHIACRQEKDLRTFKEICDVSNVRLKEIGNCFNLIREALNITLEIITTSDFIPRFCCNLGLPMNVRMAALQIARKAVELDILSGRSPISVAAVAIYMASHASGKKLTQKKISVITGVNDYTLRQCYALMYPRARELLPEEFQFDLGLLP